MKVQKAALSRGAGILMHISSLPSPYGIGSLGIEAYKFIDFLAEAGQKYWQVLPIGPTSFADSPYQSFSAFAGNPYFISIELLTREGMIKKAPVYEGDPGSADYSYLYNTRMAILKEAYDTASEEIKGFLYFCRENAAWLSDYALFMAIKSHMGGVSWQEWARGIRQREPGELRRLRGELEEEVMFHKFTQFLFFRQWRALKAYAAGRGVSIIGDLPLYVSEDSADVWSSPNLFLLDKERRPRLVAGVPPDAFSSEGQLWGNPLYDWAEHEKTNFAWWRRRIHACEKLYNLVRIDHFLGISRYFAIPAAAKSASDGK